MYKKLVTIYRWTLSIIGMLVLGIVSLVIVYLSFGLLRNFFVRYPYKYGARLFLRLSGYTFEVPLLEQFPKKQVLYIINHNSYLDIFLIAAIGLPDTRYVISEITLKFVHLVIVAKAIGTFFIPQKKHPVRRLKFFIRKTEFMKRSGKSLIVSAEGVRGYIHGIQPFNKGIFHMAMEAGVPLVPIYIHIPEEANPYKGEYSKGGKVHLELLDEIDNSTWKLDTIWEEIAKVRKVYVEKFNQLNGTHIE